jgi:lysophospholipase L1-like esterase
MALVSDSRSDWKRKIGLVWLVAALAVTACGDDAGSSDDDTGTTEEPTTGVDASTGDDDDTAPGDDDQGDDDTQGDDDDEGPSIDGGARDAGRDAGRLDASRSDASSSDGGVGDAGDETSDASTSDASVVDASSGLDAGRDASSDSSVDAARDAQSDGSTRADRGEGDGSDVLLIGDSWMSNTLVESPVGGIGPALIAVSMQPYRDRSVQGSRMLGNSALVTPIPTQWERAVAADRDIKTVVMTGGGNDVLLDPAINRDCRTGGQRCQERLDEVGRALKTLWDRMSAAGVEDIVHILYANVAGDVQDIDENNQKLRESCAAVTPARCHIFDSNEIVTMESQLADGIHPTTATNRRLATAIYEYMEEQGIRR